MGTLYIAATMGGEWTQCKLLVLLDFNNDVLTFQIVWIQSLQILLGNAGRREYLVFYSEYSVFSLILFIYFSNFNIVVLPNIIGCLILHDCTINNFYCTRCYTYNNVGTCSLKRHVDTNACGFHFLVYRSLFLFSFAFLLLSKLFYTSFPPKNADIGKIVKKNASPWKFQ